MGIPPFVSKRSCLSAFVRAFLDDAKITQVLDRWQIGLAGKGASQENEWRNHDGVSPQREDGCA